ncbi:MAG: glycosyltransferase [Chloroflexi bacterium]|uniref:Glycosyltransferase n=1 Tax=Candidatus Chlorohelix allophototropha TaxID=3003348 RepID=A0A8T7M702_9CHLR|nr:glycosyltransferase [Chloroflexota bacterium]WJW69834.1 glycosyltransferase family 2 protein [Chloroflexota bacterium L227-S17]
MKTLELTKIRSIKVFEVELSKPLAPLTDLQGSEAVWLLVTLHGLPVGDVKFSNIIPRLEPDFLVEKIVTELGWNILLHLLEDSLLAQSGYSAHFIPEVTAGEKPERERLVSLLANLQTQEGIEPPCIAWRRSKATWSVTVGVCTRNGAAQLGTCLDALEKVDYPNFEILVIDNAPEDDSTWRVVERYNSPKIRYLIEPRPGVSWARNRAIKEAHGDIIAFADDDARPDSLWLLSLVAALQRPATSLVVGAAYPQEIKNEAQVHCAHNWGHDKGFVRREYSRRVEGFPANPFNTNTYGGAYNLAAWKGVLEKFGGFDVTLGRGTLSGSASDTDLFYRMVREYEAIVYEPTALVKISYPDDFQYLIKHDNLGASGYFAFLTKCFIKEPKNRLAALKMGVNGFFGWYLHRLTKEFSLAELPMLALRLKKLSPEQRILLSSIKGSLSGPRNYFRAVKRAKEIANT